MNNKTFSNRYYKLLSEISNHPHKDELLELISDQIEDDSSVMITIPKWDVTYEQLFNTN